MRIALRKWKRLTSRTLEKNPYEHLEEDIVLLPNGKKKCYYISNRDRRAVIILAIGNNKKVLIQKEFRYPVNRVINEFPSGLMKKGETPLDAAKREFREETGFRAKRWKKIGTFYASPSRTNLQFHAYQASELTQVGNKPDPAEFIDHTWVSVSQLRLMVKNGTIKTQSVLATLYLYDNA